MHTNTAKLMVLLGALCCVSRADRSTINMTLSKFYSTTRLQENSPPGTVVSAVLVDMPNVLGDSACTASPVSHFALQQLTRTTFLLKTVGRLEMLVEEGPSYIVMVTCTKHVTSDATLLESRVSLPVSVAKSSDITSSAIPKIVLADHEVHVRENAPSGTVVTFFAVSDSSSNAVSCTINNNEHGQVTRYSQYGGSYRSQGRNYWTGNTQGQGYRSQERSFQLVKKPGGYLITTQKSLDRESMPYYDVLVTCSGKLTSYSSLSIHVDDTNDNSPQITAVNLVNIPENAASDIYVTYVNVTDKDIGDAGRVTCNILHTSFRLEQVSNELFILVTSHAMDRETRVTYGVTITCMDHGSPPKQDQHSLIVQISDVNDHVPTVTLQRSDIHVMENVPGKIYVTYVTVTDEDLGRAGNVSCVALEHSLVKTSLKWHGPGIYSLHLHGPLYREFLTDYQIPITIRCSDDGSPPMKTQRDVIIHVDAQNNRPEFSRPVFISKMSKNVTAGTVLLQVQAVDTDEGDDGAVRYGIKCNSTDLNESYVSDDYAFCNSTDLFSVATLTGEVRLLAPLQRTVENPVVEFDVIASDSGSPPLTAEAKVTIVVTDEVE